MKLTVITSNPGKVEEYRSALSSLNIEMEHLKCTYAEPQVDSLEEVVISGIRELKSRGLKNFIIDDSGLFVEALKGFPGVYSAYALKTLGNQNLLKLMQGVPNRRANFQCCIGCSVEGYLDIVVSGCCKGTILDNARGEKGFGFDPIFSVDGFYSFAEIGIEEKNTISHRGLATLALAERLKNISRV